MNFDAIIERKHLTVFSTEPVPITVFYVYILVSEEDGVFYVGEGRDNRVVSTIKDGGGTPKGKKIDDIIKTGEKVQAYIVYISDSEYNALRVEYELMLQYKTIIKNVEIYAPRIKEFKYYKKRFVNYVNN